MCDLRFSKVVSRKSVLVLNDAFRHNASLRRHAHEIGALGVTAQVNAGRVIVHLNSEEQLTIRVIHIQIINS